MQEGGGPGRWWCGGGDFELPTDKEAEDRSQVFLRLIHLREGPPLSGPSPTGSHRLDLLSLDGKAPPPLLTMR